MEEKQYYVYLLASKKYGTLYNGKLTLLSKIIPSGLILVSDYFDGWLPAYAGMTGFFVMYRDVSGSNSRRVRKVRLQGDYWV